MHHWRYPGFANFSREFLYLPIATVELGSATYKELRECATLQPIASEFRESLVRQGQLKSVSDQTEWTLRVGPRDEQARCIEFWADDTQFTLEHPPSGFKRIIHFYDFKRDAGPALNSLLADEATTHLIIDGTVGWQAALHAFTGKDRPPAPYVRTLTVVLPSVHDLSESDRKQGVLGYLAQLRFRKQCVASILRFSERLQAVVIRAQPYETVEASTLQLGKLFWRRFGLPNSSTLQVRTAGVRVFGYRSHLPTSVEFEGEIRDPYAETPIRDMYTGGIWNGDRGVDLPEGLNLSKLFEDPRALDWRIPSCTLM
jgi:hypothetical protein